MKPSQTVEAAAHTSDLALAQRVAAGDEDAFRALMRGHNQALYRTARSILRDDVEAEDVVQDAWVLAYRSLANYRGDAKLSTWLIRIVVNRAIRRRHGLDRIAAAEHGLPPASTGEEEIEMPANRDATPEAAATNAELRALLEAQIDRLPDRYREVFVLRGVEELDVAETAAALDLPEATVRTRYFRARHLLREALAQHIDVALGDAFSFAGHRCDRIVAGVFRRLREVHS